MFIPSAYAVGEQSSSIGTIMSLLPFLLIVVVMYFFMIRPQQKRAASHKTMLSELKRGDTIVTVGGIVGQIEKVNEADCAVEVASNVRIIVLKTSISGKYAKASVTPQESNGVSSKKTAAKKSPRKN
ncbi:MAG: preprotein translocase subunit YajC [Holosporales bacterium]|jgi:preprotein translocase subunit YajC|nr:preprotein translocase subunit YajC [Holosporales bacterium]